MPVECVDNLCKAVYDTFLEYPPSACPKEMTAYTVSVGRRVCNAGFYVPDVQAVEDLLYALASSPSTDDTLQHDAVEHVYDIGEDSEVSLVNLEHLLIK